jgi:hypothetical protein
MTDGDCRTNEHACGRMPFSERHHVIANPEGETIQTRRPSRWIASLGNVPLARNDGRGQVPFSKRLPSGENRGVNAFLSKRRVYGMVPVMVRVPLKKAGMIVLLAFLTFTVFYAESFVFTYLDHEHDHDGADGCCSLCSELEQVLLLFEGFGRMACAVFIALSVIYGTKRVSGMAAAYRAVPTLLALKVRLNP